jgi:hypothetical protein
MNRDHLKPGLRSASRLTVQRSALDPAGGGGRQKCVSGRGFCCFVWETISCWEAEHMAQLEPCLLGEMGRVSELKARRFAGDGSTIPIRIDRCTLARM